MYLSNVLAASVLLPTVIEGHGGIPQLLGARSVKELKVRSVFEHLGSHTRHDERQRWKRQVGGTDGMCGPSVGSCAAGSCCSPEVFLL